MAEEQIKQLTEKLQAQQAEFDNYKQQCKQLEQFLQQQSSKKEEEIRKLKQQAIKKEKNFGLMKTQLSQVEAENAALKNQLNQLKEQQSNAKPVEIDTTKFTKQIDELKNKIQQLLTQNNNLKQKVEEQKSKAQQNKKSSKGPADSGDKKKIEQALASSKSKIAELQKQNDKLKQQLSKKHNTSKQPKQAKTEQKKVERDNKQQQRLRDKIEKLEKKLTQSQSQTNRAEETSIKLSRQMKELKSKVSTLQSQKQGLAKKVKQLALSNSIKRQKQQMRQDNQQDEQFGGKDQSRIQNTLPLIASQPVVISGLIMTKKHYASPFMQVRNDNSIKILKSTKNGCFQKSLGSLRYRLNNISYDPDQILQTCVNTIKENMNNRIKSSVFLFGVKKSTKKYLLAAIINKLKGFLLQRISASQQKPEALFVKASPDPEKKLQLKGHNKQEIQQILNKMIDLAQKSPKKNEAKKKTQPKPKVRHFKFWMGEDYLEIITTSFTNIPLRQSQTISQALNNIGYSRLPNALQPLDCHRQIILTLNPIVNLYEETRNTLSITNCKKTAQKQNNDQDRKDDRSPIKQQLNDAARRKLESIQRQSEQTSLKIRKQEQEINFYKFKFDELQVRLKNLLNTHRQHNTYLKKSPVTLSYEKMLKFVHAVQAKNPSTSPIGATTKFNESYSHLGEQVDLQGDGDADGHDGDNDHEQDHEHGEQIL